MNIVIYNVINLFNLYFELIYFQRMITGNLLVTLLLQWVMEPDQFFQEAKVNTKLY